MQPIESALAEVRVGAARSFKNLTMFPLLGGRAGDPDYLTLDEALAQGAAQVTEVSAAGSVPELRFANRGGHAVLLLDGEELIGAKQNRILNLTILAPAGKTLTIPVSCVEAGRWAQRSAAFASAPRAHYASGRARKAADVSASLCSAGTRHSDQGEVWRDIAAKADRLAARSATGAMAEIYERHETDLEAFVRALSAEEEQAGALFAIGARIVGFDLFDFQATLRRLLPKLVRSCALDAVDASRESGAAPGQEAANAFLKSVAGASAQGFPAVGEGKDIRLQGDDLTGGALVARGRLVHLSAFRLHTAGTGLPGERTRMSRPSLRAARGAS